MTLESVPHDVQWLSVAEASRVCGRSKRSIRRWMADGRVTKKDGPRGVLVAITPEIVARPYDGTEAPRGTPSDMAGHVTPDVTPSATNDTDRGEAVTLRAEVERLTALVTQLTQERDRWHEAFLREQMIAGNLSGRVPQIPEKAASLEEGEPRRSWWSRLFGS